MPADVVIEALDLGGALPINEVFQTLQGEATYTGAPALFVRLQGCPVGCAFCDTKYSWDLRVADQVSVPAMLAKARGEQSYALLSPAALADLAASFPARHVVLTGGEPCLYDLRAATAPMLDRGKTVQIETSGTAEVLVDRRAWVTLSPKIGMPGGLAVLPSAVARADEIKMPVGKLADVEQLEELLAANGRPAPRGGVWLQPLSRSPKATALCIEQATARGYRVSIQVHAYIGVR